MLDITVVNKLSVRFLQGKGVKNHGLEFFKLSTYGNQHFCYLKTVAVYYIFKGARAEFRGRGRNDAGGDNAGVRGLKSLGVRELSYKLAFLACTVIPCNKRVSVRPKKHQIES